VNSTQAVVVLKTELVWNGKPLCQGCGAELDERTPNVVTILDVIPAQLNFVPVCTECLKG
jgi:hypothetical protein